MFLKPGAAKPLANDGWRRTGPRFLREGVAIGRDPAQHFEHAQPQVNLLCDSRSGGVESGSNRPFKAVARVRYRWDQRYRTSSLATFPLEAVAGFEARLTQRAFSPEKKKPD